jgi:hypothetical protein
MWHLIGGAVASTGILHVYAARRGAVFVSALPHSLVPFLLPLPPSASSSLPGLCGRIGLSGAHSSRRRQRGGEIA